MIDCAMGTPEDKAETDKQFDAALNACGSSVVVLEDGNVGPIPIEHSSLRTILAPKKEG